MAVDDCRTGRVRLIHIKHRWRGPSGSGYDILFGGELTSLTSLHMAVKCDKEAISLDNHQATQGNDHSAS